MKKSYLALGLVAAVAMSSCSNDEPVVNPNQPAGTENLVPVRLSMTTTAADVEVSGARTRGTGTVGGINPNENTWRYEDLYLLMTSSNVLCLEDGDKESGWGFTSVRGVGPYLKQQFDGSFWARPSKVKDANEQSIWSVDYKVDKNEWWYDAPIDKFYPLKGHSDFFAYYIDDAFADEPTAMTTSEIEKAGRIGVADGHSYPVITKSETQEGVNVMTVDFKIDGSQDLMAGYAAIPSTGYAAQDGGFSAQSARNNEVPQITMEHLLSRFTFQVKNGDENFNKVTLNNIKIKSLNKGTLTVASESDKENQVGNIKWVTTGAEGPAEADYVWFNLKQHGIISYSVDASNQCLAADGIEKITFDDVNFTDEPVYWTKESGLYFVNEAQEVKNEIPEEDVLSLGLVVDGEGYQVNGENKCTDNLGSVIKYNTYDVYYTATDGLYYITVEDLKLPIPMTAELSAALVENGETKSASLENGKSALVDFVSLPLNTLGLEEGSIASVGEAMFARPGDKKYTIDVVMTYLVREALDDADEAAIAAALATYEASQKTEENYKEYRDAVAEAHGELTETITQTLELTLADDAAFKVGNSYNVIITIYGLKEVSAEVKLVNWVDGGDIEVGQDDELQDQYQSAP